MPRICKRKLVCACPMKNYWEVTYDSFVHKKKMNIVLTLGEVNRINLSTMKKVILPYDYYYSKLSDFSITVIKKQTDGKMEKLGACEITNNDENINYRQKSQI